LEQLSEVQFRRAHFNAGLKLRKGGKAQPGNPTAAG
jgi:hypothetical protein